MKDDTLTMIPGPTPVDPRILEALAAPTVSHQAPQFVEAYRACLDDLRRIVRTEKGQPFVVSGSGTLAMEMALVNLVAADEKLLVVSHGFFGDRWKQLAGAFGIECDVLSAEWGAVIGPDALEERLVAGNYAAVALTHVDTSTGSAAPLTEYVKRLRGREELVLLDGVCATGGMEQSFDEWGLDLLLTGAQKAFGAPPGLALLVASERAMAKRKTLDRVPAYSADLLRWLPIMENPALYFSTPPVNQVRAFAVATRLILDEGLEQRFARHRLHAEAMRAGLAAVGMRLFTQPENLAATLSVVLYPEGIDDGEFREQMAENDVIVAGGLGPIAGRAFRIGHMGNIGPDEVLTTLQAIEASLAQLACDDEGDAAVTAARKVLAAG